jgi:AraC-like DNA-binding protein
LSLLKTHPARRQAEHGAQKSSNRSGGGAGAGGENLPYKQALEAIEKALPGVVAAIVSSLPRGSLQIVQPAKLPEGLVKAYSRQTHLEDRLTWRAIFEERPVAAKEIVNGGGDHHFFGEYLRPNGFAYAAAAPLTAPVLDGYPGAVHVYRTSEQGAFTGDDLRKLAEAAKQADAIIAKARAARRGDKAEPNLALTPRPTSRLFVFDDDGKQIFERADFDTLDPRLRTLMAEESKARLTKLNGQLMTADRVQLPDSRGDLWTFRVVTYSRYPGVADSRVVVFAMTPTCAEWSQVRPQDVAADAEMARLIPSLKFMRQEFHRGPTLTEIAKQVHLSPFHFHRRFAELLGLTPKHYLLECQIAQAKQELLARKKDLAQVATDCGFAHQSHFTSRFKQATGLTPTRWRRLAFNTAPAEPRRDA